MKRIVFVLFVAMVATLCGCGKKQGETAVKEAKGSHVVEGRLMLKTDNFMLLEAESTGNILMVNIDGIADQCDSINMEDIVKIGYDTQNGDTIMAASVQVLERWVEGIIVSMDEKSIVIVSEVDSFKFSIDKALIYGDDDLEVGLDVVVYYPNEFVMGNGGDIAASRILIE